ncbi:unnamed protein product, partial [Scytosiphon promiscuus]
SCTPPSSITHPLPHPKPPTTVAPQPTSLHQAHVLHKRPRLLHCQVQLLCNPHLSPLHPAALPPTSFTALRARTPSPFPDLASVAGDSHLPVDIERYTLKD